MIYIEWKLRRNPPPNITVIFVMLNALKKVDWERHIATRKHTNRTMSNNLEQEITPNFTHNVFVCNKCNKEYKARNSLWYHEKKCNKSVSLPKDDDIKNMEA